MRAFDRWQEAVRLMGPAFLVSVAYLDPGNWATAIEGGSRFGYDLVWVVVLSNLIAILLQTLAARLGLVTGKHLAELCRQEYPRLVCILLWVLCEISIVALDLTMVIGTAVGLNLLFRLPLLQCILLSGLDSLLLVLLVPSLGLRRGELLTVGLILVVVLCFLGDLVLSKPPLIKVISGLWPRLSRESLYTAVSLLGANVMPHNFYLHSALVTGQASQIGYAGCSVSDLIRYNTYDISAALGLALLVNVAVMLVAAATFHSAGITVRTLQDAHDLMEQILSSSVAPVAFGMALLCAGQLSTFTGTISGQVVLKGFMNIKMNAWIRRLLTRSAAIAPAALLQVMYGSAAIYQMLLIAQVVLALQLPFTLVPLIKITSSPSHMGQYASSRRVQVLAWSATLLIFAANLLLCMELIWPSTPEPTGSSDDLTTNGGQGWSLAVILGSVGELLTEHLLLGFAYVAGVIGTAAGLSLMIWMIITPLKDVPHHSRSQELPMLGDARSHHWAGGGQHLKRGRSGDDSEALPAAAGAALDDSSNGLALQQPAAQLTHVENRHQPQPRRGIDATIADQQHLTVVVLAGGDDDDGENNFAVDDGAGHQHSPPLPLSPVPLCAFLAGGCEDDAADNDDATDAPDTWEDLENLLPSPPALRRDDTMSQDVTAGAHHHLAKSTATSPAALPENNKGGTVSYAFDGLGQSSRRQSAVVVEAFWAGFYDTHGQPMTTSFVADSQPSSSSPQLQTPSGKMSTALRIQPHLNPGSTPLSPTVSPSAAIIGNASPAEQVEQCIKKLVMLPGGSSLMGRHCGEEELTLCAFEEFVTALHYDPATRATTTASSCARPPLPPPPVGCHSVRSSFGVWCILRMFQLMAIESRPDLWGRYCGALNRLQGVVFWELPPGESRAVIAEALARKVWAADAAVRRRGGAAGTAPGDLAFPKAKEIAFSVLKRYRRHLTAATESRRTADSEGSSALDSC